MPLTRLLVTGASVDEIRKSLPIGARILDEEILDE